MEALNDISKNLSKFSDQPVISRETSAPTNQEDHPIMETCASPNRDDTCTNTLSSQSLLLDQNISKTKGRKKETKSSGRIKSGVELAIGDREKKVYVVLKVRTQQENLLFEFTKKESVIYVQLEWLRSVGMDQSCLKDLLMDSGAPCVTKAS